jgi:hypothetical protein
VEPLAIDAGGEVRRQDLHDDLPPETRIMGHEHAGHAAAAQLTLEPVALAKAGLHAVPQLGHFCDPRMAERNVPGAPGRNHHAPGTADRPWLTLDITRARAVPSITAESARSSALSGELQPV